MLVIILAIYFTPLMVAMRREQPNTLAIGVLNFFLGWTMIGWVVALIWAVTKKAEK